MKININRLLENSKRSDVRGYNIYTRGLSAETNGSVRLSRPESKWDKPSFGLNGHVAIGHEIDLRDIAVPVFYSGGKKLSFSVVRNHWTPAYMTTYYRSLPSDEYTKSGLVSIKETKTFAADDTFLAELTITNDGRHDINISARLSVPFERTGGGEYTVNAKIIPGSLYKNMTLRGVAASFFDRGDSAELTIPKNSSVRLRYGFAFELSDTEKAKRRLCDAFSDETIFADAERRFNQWMADHAPRLICEDTDIMRVYYYRLFVVKCAIHTPRDVLPESDFDGLAVYESPFGSWFGAPVGLPVPLQIEELKWLRLSDVTRQHIQSWVGGKGCMMDYIQFTPAAILDHCKHNGDMSLIGQAYGSAVEYTLRGCGEGESLPVTVGSWVTGAEYQPSFYQHTSPQWDWRHDSEGEDLGFEKAKLHRLDECVMLAMNLKAICEMARILDLEDDRAHFEIKLAELTKRIESDFYDPKTGFFFDIDVSTGKLCDEAPCYDSFMPAMLDIGQDVAERLFGNLKDDTFACDFGITSVSRKCPMYHFDNCIVGPTEASLSKPHYYHCCWNGPVWPFAVSLVLASLGHSMKNSKKLKETFSELFSAYTELHFDGGDRSVPCICEHYRPTDGMSFSRFTEYFHSTWLDLFFSHLAGIGVTDNGVEFDPVYEGELLIDGVFIRGKRYRFEISADGSRSVCCEE